MAVFTARFSFFRLLIFFSSILFFSRSSFSCFPLHFLLFSPRMFKLFFSIVISLAPSHFVMLLLLPFLSCCLPSLPFPLYSLPALSLVRSHFSRFRLSFASAFAVRIRNTTQRKFSLDTLTDAKKRKGGEEEGNGRTSWLKMQQKQRCRHDSGASGLQRAGCAASPGPRRGCQAPPVPPCSQDGEDTTREKG